MRERTQHQAPDGAQERAPQDTKAKAGGDTPLLSLQRRAGNSAVLAALAGAGVQPKLQVGAVHDPAEAEADRMADAVLRQLDAGAAGSTPARVNRRTLRRSGGGDASTSAGHGLDGGAVDDDVAARIQGSRSGGSPLEPGLRSEMESGFGADFSGVRVHTGGAADDLSRSLNAEAFATGRDIFFAEGAYDPSSAAGKHTIAHELAHTVQQGAAAQRTPIRRFVALEDFRTRTSEGFLTQKSTAQTQIEKWLTEYNALGVPAPKPKKGEKPGAPQKVKIPDAKLGNAIQLVKWMVDGVDLWVAAHTMEEKNEQGEVTSSEFDKKRTNRLAGMEWFKEQATNELAALQARADAYTGPQDEVIVDPAGHQKLKEHYTGTLPSILEKAAWIIDMAVPNPYDTSELEIEVKMPVSPGVFVGGVLALSAERGEKSDVEISAELGVKASGEAGVAELAGTLGGYIKSKGPDAPGALRLISYGFYRRLAESNAVPAEVSSLIWGGRADSFGKKKADKWSRGVEEQLLGARGEDGKTVPKPGPEPVAPEPLSPEDEKKPKKKKAHEERVKSYEDAKAAWDAQKAAYEAALSDNDNSVETGGYGEFSGEVGVNGVAKIGGSAKVSVGKKYDAESLDIRKGGAGKENKKSDSWFTKNVASKVGTDRGAEKSLSRTHIGTEVKGTWEAGPFSGDLSVELSWMGSGEHGKKVDDYTLEDIKIAATAGADLPVNELIGDGRLPFMTAIADQLSNAGRALVAKANGETETNGKAAGRLLKVGESFGSAVTQLGQVPTETFAPKFEIEPDELGVQGTAGLSVGFEYSYEPGAKPDPITGIAPIHGASFELRHNKKVTGTVPELLKVELTRSSRILGLGWKTGGKWSLE